MGYNLGWIATRGKSADAVLSELGLARKGRGKCFWESFSAILVPAGWYVIIEDHYCSFIEDQLLAKVSMHCEIVTCSLSENTMFSAASQWQDGRNLWRVEHDGGSRGVEDLKCSGELPPEFAPIHDRLFATQKSDTSEWRGHGTDYIFEIPVELVGELTGYRYDKILMV